MKKKILIIEDNSDLAKLYELAFGNDFQVKVATNATEGLAKANNFKPDLILLDILLGLNLTGPTMDGYEILKNLRLISHDKTVIIVNSNLAQEEAETKALRLGANAFIKKANHSPFETVEKVKQLLAPK